MSGSLGRCAYSGVSGVLGRLEGLRGLLGPTAGVLGVSGGLRLPAGAGKLALVAGRPIDRVRSQQVLNYSAGGFEWGYDGAVPAQFALSLLLEAGLPDEVAKVHCQAFKQDFLK